MRVFVPVRCLEKRLYITSPSDRFITAVTEKFLIKINACFSFFFFFFFFFFSKNKTKQDAEQTFAHQTNVSGKHSYFFCGDNGKQDSSL